MRKRSPPKATGEGQVAGLEMYGTVSSRQLDVVTDLRDTPIDYRTEDFLRRIRELTGDGVGVVIDTVGGAGHLWLSYRALRPGGRLVWLASAATHTRGLIVGPISMATVGLLRLLPVALGGFAWDAAGRYTPRCPLMPEYAQANPAWYRQTLAELLDLLAARQLQPLNTPVPLEDASRAHQMLEQGGHTGKIVLLTDAYTGTAKPTPP